MTIKVVSASQTYNHTKNQMLSKSEKNSFKMRKRQSNFDCSNTQGTVKTIKARGLSELSR